MKMYETIPVRYSVCRLGASAAGVLANPGKGQVAAVFDRSCYCLVNNDYVCVGVETLDLNPLNVITPLAEGGPWLSYRIATGMPVAVGTEHLRIGPELYLDLRGAPVWSPPRPADLDFEAVKSGLAAFDAAATKQLPADGLGRCVNLSEPGDHPPPGLLKYTAGPVRHLEEWLTKALRDPRGNGDPGIDKWLRLLGSGPGLTPSGDDLVGGVMLALHRLGQFSNLRSLSSAVSDVLQERTNPISAAHLKTAMEGMGGEAVHRAMDTIIANDSDALPAALAGIDKIGHTSGWDALAGIVIALRSWVEVNGVRSRFRSN